MPIGILNNIASLSAENQLSITNSSLQSTLYQLSSGSRINTGADDAAGLAIANGLQANITALTQSARNANDGVGSLQVADGALAQVTTLLNRAVTLATESATGTVGNSQRVALNNEYAAIQNEIDRIGGTTTYNGTAVFNGSSQNIFLSDSNLSSQITLNSIGLSSAGLLGAGGASGTLAANGAVSASDALTIGGTTYTFVAGPLAGGAKSGATAAAVNVVIDSSADPVTALQNTLANLAAAINGGAGAGTLYQAGGGANADVTASASGNTVSLAATPTGQAAIAAGGTIASTVGTGAEFGFLNGATFSAAAGTDLLSATAAQAALTNINAAIQTVAGERGAIGAVVNRLQSASNVISNQVQNLTSAENGIVAADIPSAVANLTKYSILEQTGISSLAQANQQQQLVLKLLQ
jgi:flagellin